MGGILSLAVAGSMGGFGVCGNSRSPAEEQGEEGQGAVADVGRVRSLLKQGESGREPDAVGVGL